MKTEKQIQRKIKDLEKRRKEDDRYVGKHVYGEMVECLKWVIE